MESEKRIKSLEDEVKVLKGEVKTVLLDIREHYLDLENPFNQYRPAVPVEEAPADISEAEKTQGTESQHEKESVPKDDGTGAKEPVAQSTVTAEESQEKHEAGVNKKKIDWVTIVGLARWVDKATSKLGKSKVEALIEVYHSTGCMSDSFRYLLLKLTHLSDAEEHKGQVSSRDYLSVLVQLESVLNGGVQREAALLSILSDEEDLK